MVKPYQHPGRDLPEEGWTRNPKPGLYFVRYCNEDGTKTQPAFCVVLPTGPVDTHACWAETPNMGVDSEEPHESEVNYFVDPEQPIEYFPFSGDVITKEGVYVKCSFEIISKPL